MVNMQARGSLACRLPKFDYEDDDQFDYPLPLLSQFGAGVWMSESK
jgi:hypothetical protein